jgi:hypothetical protein
MAVYDSVVPDILVQSFENGDGCTGVAYTGLDKGVRTVSAGHALNARIRWDRKSGDEVGAIDGGLFDLGTMLGPTIFPQLIAVWISLPGVTAIELKAVSDDGSEYTLSTVSASTLIIGEPNAWSLLPGWKIKVVATGTLTGDGTIRLVLPSWTHPFSSSHLE